DLTRAEKWCDAPSSSACDLKPLSRYEVTPMCPGWITGASESPDRTFRRHGLHHAVEATDLHVVPMVKPARPQYGTQEVLTSLTVTADLPPIKRTRWAILLKLHRTRVEHEGVD